MGKDEPERTEIGGWKPVLGLADARRGLTAPAADWREWAGKTAAGNGL